MTELTTLDCPLEGSDSEDPVTHRQLNSLIRRVDHYHLRPIKKQLEDAATQAGKDRIIMEGHLRECDLRQAQIIGGMKANGWWLKAIAALFSLATGLFGFATTMWGKFMGYW